MLNIEDGGLESKEPPQIESVRTLISMMLTFNKIYLLYFRLERFTLKNLVMLIVIFTYSVSYAEAILSMVQLY